MKQEIKQKEAKASSVIDVYKEPGYTPVTKLGDKLKAPIQPSYIHVSRYVSDTNLTELNSLTSFLKAIEPDTTKKLIFLLLHSNKIYCGLAKKVLKIQTIEFQRQINKLLKAGIVRKANVKNSNTDPFIRWAKQYTPNLSKKLLKLYKLDEKFRLFFCKLESELESYFDRGIIDEIKHFRFAIKRTHRDIQREKRMKIRNQKKLFEQIKKEPYKRKVGVCVSCDIDLFEIPPSRSNPESTAFYKCIDDKFYCFKCGEINGCQ